MIEDCSMPGMSIMVNSILRVELAGVNGLARGTILCKLHIQTTLCS